MKMLIIGASGQIGSYLAETLRSSHCVTGTFYAHPRQALVQMDMTARKLVDKMVGQLAPDVILIPAAMPNVEVCQQSPDLCCKVNAKGVFNVLDAAEAVQAKVVYFSTDYIFDGINGPYRETDRPNPKSVYGKVKYKVEQRILQAQVPFLIIRTTVVYSRENQGKNFAMGLINRLKKGEAVKVPYDQVVTPTYAPNLCQVVRELIELGKEGIYHVAGPDLMDRYEFSLEVAKTFGLGQNLIIPVSTVELGQKAPRPLNGGLRIDRVQAQVSTPLMGVREGLAEMKRQLDRHPFGCVSFRSKRRTNDGI